MLSWGGFKRNQQEDQRKVASKETALLGAALKETSRKTKERWLQKKPTGKPHVFWVALV